MLSGFAGMEISKEEGGNRLAPSFAMLKCVVRLRLCGYRRQSGPNDDIIQHGCSCIEVVVIPAVTLSQQTTSSVLAHMWRRFLFQMLLASG